MKKIANYDFTGKRALIRVDFNVPLDSTYNIVDTMRIDATIPTITRVLNGGGAVILMSHLGRPKGGYEEKYSLRHLVPYLSKVLGVEVKFAGDCAGLPAEECSAKLKPGEVLLLENLRFYKEEEKGDEAFAGKLASLGDVYVNDAFGTAHRAHASTAVIARFFPEDKMFGFVMEEEVMNINKVLHDAGRPFTAILGGAKVSGKIEIIQNLLPRCDHLLIGGGMTFTFIKALGGKVGNSLFEADLVDLAKSIMNEARQRGVCIHLPVDTLIADAMSEEALKKECMVSDIPDGWMGLDIGKDTIKKYIEVIELSRTILWNGPMGVFEMAGFEAGTKAVAEAIARATKKGAFSLVGGGDSVAAINRYGLAAQVSYVSTGGGAMLECIEGKILPGVRAIMS